jgi:hypothetical protein
MSRKLLCNTVDGDAFLLPRNKVGNHIILKGDGSHSVQSNTLHENLGSLITPTVFLDQTCSQVTKAVTVCGTAGLIKRKREVFHSVIMSAAKVI